MNKKLVRIISITLVLLGSGWCVYLLTLKSQDKSTTQSAMTGTKVVNVDDVVADPEKYTGIIGVEGTATKVDDGNMVFTLGCEDACIQMPVKFRGRLPKEGTNVIAYGEVKKTEQAKYIFIAQEISEKIPSRETK